jgi:hypothetical protein
MATGYMPRLPNVKTVSITLLLLASAGLVPLQAQEDESRQAKLFDSEESLEITLSAPWQDLVRNSSYKGSYPATIEYRNAEGNTVQHQLTVERRGVLRQETCSFPPVKWRFEKDQVKGTLFQGQNSIKMVTHCEHSRRFEQYYRLEMLAYRIYNLLTDYSFRVRPLKVTYRDSKKDKVDEDRFAFIIEDDSDVAERNGLIKLETPRMYSSRLDKETISMFALFQLLIGNLDWSVLKGRDPEECCHNVKLIAAEHSQDSEPIYPVPYDFDAAGIVDAPYVGPPQGLGVSSITQRLYRGFCSHNGALPDARAKILANETAILDIVRNDEMLAGNFQRKPVKYLEKYFDMLRDDGEFNKQVVRKCRK